MASIKAPATVPSPGSRYDRLTARGQARVDMVDKAVDATDPLSRYQYDVLEMCRTGVWFAQLQQFMPPRSLDESLRSLLEMGMIETVDAGEAPRHVSSAQHRKNSKSGDLMRL